MATIYDVAKEVKVSPKTVSRVLNGEAPVREETRKAVEAAIRKLGYVPSTAARSMKSNRTGLIGLITGAISTASRSEAPEGLPELHIVQGIQQRMAESGKTLLISDTNGQAEKIEPLVRTFMEHRVEGLIHVAGHHQRVELPEILDGAKLVLINCYDDAGSVSVLPDDAEGQRRLVEALIGHGHRRIAYLTLSEAHEATRLRLDGYRTALEAAGIGYDPALVASGDDGSGSMSRGMMWGAVRRMMALDAPPTVICCGNDRMAMRLYGLLRAEGIAVPEGMSVAGYDDYRIIAEGLLPPLTTVELPYAEMGRVGAERLLSLIDDETVAADAAPVLVRGECVWRDSVMSLTN